MSKKQQRMPGMMNGNSPKVPDDLVWDPDNIPVLYKCSNMPFHNPDCGGQCGEMDTITEAKVNLINEGLAWARAGMNWQGVPRSFLGIIPVVGIPVELTDVLVWLELLRDTVCELTGKSTDEFDEEFAIKKYEKLHEMRMEAEDRVRKERIADQFGIVEKKLLRPDGHAF